MESLKEDIEQRVLAARALLARQSLAAVRGRIEPEADALLGAAVAALGEEWVGYVCEELEAIVVADVPGCYDPDQRVVFVNSRQPPSEQVQQLLMELSNHQNRGLFREVDAAARQMDRATFIRRIEQIEFAGVQNVIRTYDQAHQQRLDWARDPRGCVYGAMRGLSFDQYFQHLSAEHRERIGQRHDRLTQG